MNDFKIAFLLQKVIMGGVEKVLIEYIKEIKKQTNWEISVYSDDKVTDKYFLNFFKNNNIKLKDYFKLTKPKNFFAKLIYKIINPFYKPIGRIILSNNLKKHNILIDFENFHYAKYIKKTNQTVLVWTHNSINFFNQNSSHFLKNMNKCDKLVCLSDSFKEDFIEQYPEYSSKIIKLYNPINIKDIENKAKTDKSLGNYFIVVSRLDTDKDIETVIQAFKKFSLKEKKSKLLIVGEGKSKAKLEKMADKNPQIQFLGKVNEPYTLIKNATASILSSYNEGLGNILIENAILKTLSISSNCKSSIKEILLNGKAGIMFTPGDKDQLAQIFSDICNKKINSKKMVETAYQNLDRFKPEKIIKEFIKVINNLYKNK